MKIFDFGFIVMLIIISAVGAIGILSHQKKIKDDGIIEELLEEVIEVQTGLDVDITPNSKEASARHLP